MQEGKCKTTLQASLNLDNGPRIPVASIIGRFDADSGFDVLGEVLTQILERNIEVILMGSGQPEIIERIRTMESSFQGRCRLGSSPTSHRPHPPLQQSRIFMKNVRFAQFPAESTCAPAGSSLTTAAVVF